MKTKSERFVDKNLHDWNLLKNCVNKIRRKGVKSLNNKELEAFPGLYRKISQDLAQARMLKLSPDVLQYLNNLTSSSHEELYFLKPLTLSELKSFFTKTLPATLFKNFIFIIISAALFFGSGAISYYIVQQNPEAVYSIIDEGNLRSIESMHSSPPGSERDVSEKSTASAFYINHNLSIAFLSFATGIFIGLGTVYVLLFNGIYLGCIFSHLTNKGYIDNLIHFVTAHSFLELVGLVLAGAAGLLLGFTVIKTWKNYSKEILFEEKNRILILLSAGFFMVGSAAFIEGFISPSTLPYSFKLTTLLLTIMGFIFYFFILPVIRRSKNEL